jgi:hypothetical protein
MPPIPQLLATSALNLGSSKAEVLQLYEEGGEERG